MIFAFLVLVPSFCCSPPTVPPPGLNILPSSPSPLSFSLCFLVHRLLLFLLSVLVFVAFLHLPSSFLLLKFFLVHRFLLLFLSLFLFFLFVLFDLLSCVHLLFFTSFIFVFCFLLDFLSCLVLLKVTIKTRLKYINTSLIGERGSLQCIVILSFFRQKNVFKRKILNPVTEVINLSSSCSDEQAIAK